MKAAVQLIAVVVIAQAVALSLCVMKIDSIKKELLIQEDVDSFLADTFGPTFEKIAKNEKDINELQVDMGLAQCDIADLFAESRRADKLHDSQLNGLGDRVHHLESITNQR